MNIFFKIDGKIVTPMLNGSILPGITRNSVIQLCKDWGLDVEERKISVEELIDAQKNGKLEECFGTGTAAVISPVGKLRYKDDVMLINSDGIIIRMQAKEISKLGRATQGVKIMNVKEETNIISLAKVARQDELEKEIKEDEEPKEGEQMELK